MRGGATQDRLHDLDRTRDLIVGGCVTGGEAQAAERLVQAQAHRQQDVRRVERTRRTCGPARRGHACQVQRQQHVFAAPAGKGAGREIWQSRFAAREESTELEQRRAQGAGLTLRLARTGVTPISRRGQCGCDGDGRRDVFEARATSPLLGTAKQEGVDPDAVPHEEHAPAAGAEFVPAERNQVGVFRQLDPPRSGARVHVNDGAYLVCARDDFRHRLDRADLIVRETDRNQGCPRADGVRVRPGGAVDGRDEDVTPIGLHPANRRQDRLVLCRPCHDAPAFRQQRSHTEQRQVHRFGAGGDERDLASLHAQRAGGAIARTVEGCACGTPFGVWARRIARGHIAKRVADLGQDGRRTGVVEIDPIHRPGGEISRGWGPAAGSAL